MSESDAGEVTALLRRWHAGDEDAYRQVSSIPYIELRRQAAQHMRRKAQRRHAPDDGARA